MITLIFNEINIHYSFERFMMFSEFIKTFLNFITIIIKMFMTLLSP